MASSGPAARPRHPDALVAFAEDLHRNVLRPGWGFRLELLLVGLVAAVHAALSAEVGEGPAAVLVVVAAGGLLLVSPLRRGLRRRLHAGQVRRRWSRAVRAAGLETEDERIPRAKTVRPIPSGDLLAVRVPRGSSVPDLQRRTEVIAAALGVMEVRVHRDPATAAWADVVLVSRDPLASPEALAWPHTNAAALSLWNPIPLGVDEDGDAVSVLLPERNVLIGGEPGAGKSVGLSMLVATAALDPACRLWLFDGKLVELAAWGPCAERAVGPDGDGALSVLRELRAEMDSRYRHLLESGLRKVSPGDGLPLYMVVCDELAFYLTLPDRKQRTEFAELMRDLVARGRAAGIIVVAATQKPSADVIPTSLRDLFGFRWALRCNTPQASDTILGQGWASMGFDAAKVAGGLRGVGYLLAEGTQPVRLKSCFLGDQDVAAIAARATALRAGAAAGESEAA